MQSHERVSPSAHLTHVSASHLKFFASTSWIAPLIPDHLVPLRQPDVFLCQLVIRQEGCIAACLCLPSWGTKWVHTREKNEKGQEERSLDSGTGSGVDQGHAEEFLHGCDYQSIKTIITNVITSWLAKKIVWGDIRTGKSNAGAHTQRQERCLPKLPRTPRKMQ